MRVTRGSWPNPLYKILNQPPRAPVCENQTYTVKPVLSGHPLLSGRGHLQSTWNCHFLFRNCLELSPTNFSIFTLKTVTWRTCLISFTVQYCFLFRFVCIEFVSLIWFLQIWVAIYDQLVHFDKEITANVYHHSLSWSILNVSTVHLNGIWHLIWRYLSKPVLGGHPVLSGHYSIPQGCPLNTGFTVVTRARM